MPKKFTPKPPVEKLSLALRKDIRDNFESKKADYESQITEVLDIPVSIKIDVNTLWAYENGNSAGSMLAGYVEGFIEAAKRFVETYGNLGKEYFKNAVHKGEFTVAVNELGDDASTIDADVQEGVFRILFRHDCLGYNQSSLSDPFLKAIDNAPHEHSPVNLRAKHSIDIEYTEEVEDVRSEIASILNLPDVILEPNFEKNYEALSKKQDKDWRNSFGRAALEYFRDGIKSQLVSQGFKGDDMLQEGFAEVVTSKTIAIRVVEKTKSGSMSEVLVEDGTVYIQTTPECWWYNVYDAGRGLLDLL